VSRDWRPGFFPLVAVRKGGTRAPGITIDGDEPSSSRAQANEDVLHRRRYEHFEWHALKLAVRGNCDQAL
jgi:hypothetical protein